MLGEQLDSLIASSSHRKYGREGKYIPIINPTCILSTIYRVSLRNIITIYNNFILEEKPVGNG